MTLSIDLGKASAKGSSNLFIGMVLSNIILAVGSIFIARLLGSDQYGLYALSAVPANFLGLCVSFGVYPGMVRYLAKFAHQGENENAKRIIASSLLFLAIVGSVFAISAFFVSGTIANYLGRPEAALLFEIYSFVILTDALVTASFFIFVGLETTHYYSALQVFQAVLKVIVALLLVIIGLGPLGAVVGYALASSCSCILGMLIVVFPIWRRLHHSFGGFKMLSSLRMMIGYGFPLYIRDLAKIGTETHVLNFLMVIYASNVFIGNYRVALNFHVLLNFIAFPISTMLFPIFSKLDFGTDSELLKTVFVSSVRYTSLFIVPATVMLVVLSEPAILTLYGESYSLAPLFLSLSALIFLYAALGQFSIVNFLSSQGETMKNMLLGFANALAALISALILIPHYEIFGLIASLIISGSPTIVIGTLWMRKLYGISIDWNRTLRTFVCSFLVGIITFTVLRFVSLSPPLELAIGLLVFSFSLVVFSPLVGAINLDDISNLRKIFTETILIPKILKFPFILLSESCKFADRAKEMVGKLL